MTENPLLNTAVWFDLDDTLALELDFCKSGFRAVARALSSRLEKFCSPSEIELVMSGAADCKMNHYDALQGFLESVMPPGNENQIEQLVKEAVTVCREHTPDNGYALKPGVAEALNELKRNGVPMGIITDGRSSTQRAKFLALGLDEFISADRLLISEELGTGKESPEVFIKARELSGEHGNLFYVADNPSKDFFHPNALGWNTVMVAPDRRNIHFPYPAVDAAHSASVTAKSAADAVKIILSNKLPNINTNN